MSMLQAITMLLPERPPSLQHGLYSPCTFTRRCTLPFASDQLGVCEGGRNFPVVPQHHTPGDTVLLAITSGRLLGG